MHGNRKNGGLNRARVLGSFSILAVPLKSIVSGNSRTRRSAYSRTEPGYLGDAWSNIDVMRRRLTL